MSLVNALNAILGWLIISPVVLAGMFFLGVKAIVFVVPTIKRSYLIACAPVVGAALASVVLNDVGLLFGWWVAFGVLSVCAIVCLVWGLKDLLKAEPDDEWKGIKRYLPWVMVCALGLSFMGGFHDEAWHFPFASVIANGHLPTPLLSDPTRPTTYHYGFDILVAALSAKGWIVPFASDVLQACLQVSLLAIVFLILRNFGITRKRSAIGTAVVFFTGIVGWVLWPLKFISAWFVGMPIIFGAIWNCIYNITFTKSTIAALGLIWMTLLFLQSRFSIKANRFLLLLPLLLSAIALSSETIFIFFLPFVILGLLVDPISRGYRKQMILACFVGLVLVFLQGGLITDAVKGHIFTNQASADQVQSTAITIQPSLDLPRFTQSSIFNLSQAGSWVRLLAELGGVLLVSIFAFTNIKKYPRAIKFVILGCVICLAVPFILHLGAYPQNILRVWMPAFAFLLVLGMASWMSVQRPLKWVERLVMCVLIVGGVGSLVVGSLPGKIGLLNRNTSIQNSSLLFFAFDPTSRLPSGSSIWVNSKTNDQWNGDGTRQIPTVFGVPDQACLDLFLNLTSDKCLNFQRDPTERTLRELGVTHMLLTPEFVERIKNEPWFGDLVPVATYDVPSWAKRLPSFLLNKDYTPFTLFRVKM